MKKAFILLFPLLFSTYIFAQDTLETGAVPFQDLDREEATVTSAGGRCIPVRENLSEESLAYQAGEHFEFSIHYTWGIIDSDVGTATVDLDTVRVNGERAFLCKIFGKTIRWYDRLFKVREDFQSTFAVDGLRPLKFTRDTQEGKYIAKNNYTYVWDTDEPTIVADVYTPKSGQRTVNLDLDNCTFDLPALFFFARNMDFDAITPGIEYPMTFAIDDDVYDVYFIWKGRENLKVKGLGTMKTVKFAAKLVAGSVFTGDEDLSIWVTDDDNRVPVYFEAPILVGHASGRLCGYSGLKHEFTSMIKKKK